MLGSRAQRSTKRCTAFGKRALAVFERNYAA
jgi:hypothetical protein